MQIGRALLAAAAAATALTVGAEAQPTARPTLRAIDESPFTVRGTGFVPGERVTVVVAARDTWRRIVTAGQLGGFTAVFRAASIDSCQPFYVRATGDRGSRAVLRRIVECIPSGPAA